MHRALIAATLTTATVLASATSVDAKRPATDVERSEVAAAVGVLAECSDVAVSTVDGAWAAWRGVDDAERCQAGNGVMALRHAASGWRVEHEGPDERATCDVAGIHKVPGPVAADLLLCRAVVLSRHVYVPGTSGRLTTKPRQLGVGAKGGLERLHWRGWDRFQTWARGWYTIAGFIGEPNSGYSGPVRVRFYARKTCRGGKRIYTKMQIVPIRARDKTRYLPFRRGAEWTSCTWLEEDGKL